MTPFFVKKLKQFLRSRFMAKTPEGSGPKTPFSYVMLSINVEVYNPKKGPASSSDPFLGDETVSEKLNSLNGRAHEIFRMYLEGYKIQEISEYLDIPYDWAENYIAAVRAQLKWPLYARLPYSFRWETHLTYIA